MAPSSVTRVSTHVGPDRALADLLTADTRHFDHEYYRLQLSNDGPEMIGRRELAEHYLLHGERLGFYPSLRFDPRFYSRSYPDVTAKGGLLVHFLLHGEAEGRFPTAGAQLLAHGLVDRMLELNLVPVAGSQQNLSLPEAVEEVVRASRNGDPAIYFSSRIYDIVYADVGASELDPLYHFLRFGHKEGRLTSRDILGAISTNPDRTAADRQWLIVAAHESSRTGAPIVARHVADSLQHEFNVVFVSLRPGSMSVDVAGQFAVVYQGEGGPSALPIVMEYIQSRYDCRGAILSSCECEPLMRVLAWHRVPFVTLVHEYPEYTFPRDKLFHTVILSDKVVFSSYSLSRAWARYTSDVQLPADNIGVVAQPAEPTRARGDRRLARRLIEESTGLSISRRRLIIGAGHVQMRKGTDLFAQVAISVAKRSPDGFRFVWIGDGYSGSDLSFGVWLQTLATKSDYADRTLAFIPAGALYGPLFDAADAFLLSSRLDPLPNVALAARTIGLPVFFFSGASGFEEGLSEAERKEVGADYLDVDGMATRILKYFGSRRFLGVVRRPSVGSTERLNGAGDHESRDYQTYSAWLRDELRIVTERTRAAAQSWTEVTGIGPVEIAPLGGKFGTPDEALRRARWITQDCIARGVAYYNPRPGLSAARSDAGSYYLYESRPVRVSEALRPINYSALIHVHCFYPELLTSLLPRLSILAPRLKSIFTTDSESKASSISDACRTAGVVGSRIIVVPNRGRDIGPFLDTIPALCGSDDQIVGHLHTKKSPEIGSDAGSRWREESFDALMSNEALELIGRRDIGLVFPDSDRCVGWGLNAPFADSLVPDLLEGRRGHPGPFPMGNMFWTKARILREMAARVVGKPWPAEPVAYDGTVLHAIERVWPVMCEFTGLRWAAVHLEEDSR